MQWIAEVEASGIQIPDIPPNNPGGCPNNTNVDPSAKGTCWWTCGGCTAFIDVTKCPNKYTWGLTYDDGPAFYTTELLAYLSEHNLKSTFFAVGSRCLEFPKILQVEYTTGNQIAIHTWSHPYLTTLTNNEIIAELGWSKQIMKDVLGVTPNYMRPPYGDIDNRVRTIAVAMGLIPVMWTSISPVATFDTGDFYIASGSITSYGALEKWQGILNNVSTLSTGFIVLEHDLFEQTVDLAIGYILPDALAYQPPFTIEPVISCLGLPFSDAYIETNNNETHPPLSSGSFVTIVHPSATATAGGKSGSGSGTSAASPRFSVGFSVMFITTVVSLLVSVYAIRF
jgi:peptidoglycan/xylan/chitin deacetylase (PgdA/CDA1 family)